MESRKLSALERTFVSAMTMLGELSEGYSVAFMEELVRQHGISGFFKWAQGTNKAWGALVERFGERDAHLLACFASLGNGCHYCAYGHLLAFNLHVFEEREELVPLDERELSALMMERDAAVLETLRARLASPPYETIRKVVERLYVLRGGAQVEPQPEDEILHRAIALYEWVNECSIVSENEEAPPLGRIAKNKVLRQRYEMARSRQREGGDGNGKVAAAAG